MNTLPQFDLDAIYHADYAFWQRTNRRDTMFIDDKTELFEYCLNRRFTLHEIRDCYRLFKSKGEVEVEV